MENLAQFSLETDLHSLLKRAIDLLQMEYFVLKLLNLVDVAHVLGVGLHLARWLGILVNQLILKQIFFLLELYNARVNVLDFLLREKQLLVPLLYLVFKSFKIALVLLFNLPILKLATMIAICTSSSLGLSHSLTNPGANFAARLCCSVKVRRQGFALLGLEHLSDEGCNLELSRASILRQCKTCLKQILDLRIR